MDYSMNVDEYQKMYEFESTYWWFVGRRNIIFNLLSFFCRDAIDNKILDVGCGTGINLKYFGRLGFAIGIDSSREALNFCKKRGEKRLIRADAKKMPFKDETFSIIYALDVLEHVENDAGVLHELYRVCKEDGRIIITVPAYNILWSEHDEALQHKRRYAVANLKAKVNNAGFELEKISYMNMFVFPLIFIFRIYKKFFGNKLTPKTDLKRLPHFLNNIFIYLLNLESLLIKKIYLPIGVSLICVAKKINSNLNKY